jgi:predicted RNA-binding Zn-ribbon protein involved in translation (DUF1610 family)
MTTIKCPKCQHDIEINISKAVDEHGEVFQCSNCNYLVRYTKK